MSIFEVPQNRLLELTDLQLEELVARLAEAEVSSRGGQVSDVTWSGSINAPDGGVDVRVAVSTPGFEGDLVKRANTIFQVKKPRMRPADIRCEMTENGELLQVISEQAAIAGAYIIVSLAEDNAEPERNRRLEAMQNAIAGDPKAPDIAIDFYDRSRLHQWLRSYPGVMLWVREQLGIPLSGWQPHGRWSPTPADVDDTIIFDEGVTVDVPAEDAQGISLEDALQVVRQLVRNTVKSIRIAGLSGVGKTRFVQALFEENTGADALDRTKVIYVDTGADPNPSARSMIDTLVSEGREVTIVLDNCPSDLHAHLASRVANNGGAISLITVEYDIREDKPQTTEVVHIEADGPEISERLVLRRFPGVGQANSRRIAEVANGNARIALAIAERVEAGEPLALLSDTDLFNRLFHQRNNPDQNLKERTEVLSLVYSFSVQPDEGGVDELSVLAGLCGATRMQMFRATATLLDRHVAQKRSHWRAILPHAIANKLAVSALDAVPVEILRETFEHQDRPRLLKSFARRLGYFHEHPIAREIVDTWFSEGGLLSNILELNDLGTVLLRHVAPVAPEALLALLDTEIKRPDFTERCPVRTDRRSTITSLLASLAYESEMFDQCVELLLIIAVTEDPSNNYDSTREKIKRLFQAYLSGSHATHDQRMHIVRECLWSSEPERRAIGAQLLSAALDGPPWNGFGLNEFGSRSRDYGYQPTYEQYDDWMNGFLSVAVDAGLSDQNNLSELARGTLANEFRETWRRVTLRPRLIEIANSLNEQQPWVKGWKAVRSTIYFDHKEIDGEDTDQDGLRELRGLEESLRPIDLISEIEAVVFGDGYDAWLLDGDQEGHEEDFSETEKRMNARARDLGQTFVRSDLSIDVLTPKLFESEHAPFRHSFGVGLAAGSSNLHEDWNGLLDALRTFDNPNWNYGVLVGFIEGVVEADPDLARDILDECAIDPLTRPIIVRLHPFTGFTDDDLDRCAEVLVQGEAGPWMYGDLLWRDQYADLSREKIINLAQLLLEREGGATVFLKALMMKRHGEDRDADILGSEFRRLGLLAAAQKFGLDDADFGGSDDHIISQALKGILPFPEHEAEKEALLDAIFSTIDETYGYLRSVDKAMQVIVAQMTEGFLDRVFIDDEDKQDRRSNFFRNGMHRKATLGLASTEQLIAWCGRRGDPEIWPRVALGMMPYETVGEDKESVFSEQAMQFLEASPNPLDVLAAYADRLSPMSWSGSLADIIERRLGAFHTLASHDNREIVDAASNIIEQTIPRIEAEREREKQRDEEREQRFE